MSRAALCLAIICLVLALACPVAAHERNDGKYFTIVDESGKAVFLTGWVVAPGDQCLTEDNRRFEVVSVSGDTAHAKFLGKIDMTAYEPKPKANRLAGVFSLKTAQAQGSKVAIYHTHSDESYVPTDGTESVFGNGGIYKVGGAFASALKTKGLEAVQSQARHDPHDNMAYERSRRTALDLIKKEQPAAVFDIHRDALPPDAYNTTINGKDVTKVQLVVGKYGPTGKQIEDYALQIKAASDKEHPGLVKGIFFAKGGDYNQDLHPRSMLIEVGSHTNDRAAAERGVALFADVVPGILGQTSGAPQSQAGEAGLGTRQAGPSGASKSIGWIVGLLIVGGAAFLFLSTGGVKEAGAKLKQLGSREFANFLAPKARRKPKDDADKDSHK